MAKASHLPLRHRAHRSSEIIFNLIFILCCSIPVAIVMAASFKLVGIMLAFLGLMALYDTIQSIFILLCAGQTILASHRSSASSLSPDSATSAPSFAVIIPGWNEQAALPHTIDSVLAQSVQPDLIIVSDDGSTDETIATLTILYALEFEGEMGQSRIHPHLRVLRKPHSGKADSMNQAIARAPVDIVLTLDADTRVLPGSFAALREAFRVDPGLTVVSGVLLPRCVRTTRGILYEFEQRYEYARMQIWRLVWSRFNSSLIVSGACAAFRRETLLAAGGFNPKSWGEDYEVMFRMHQYMRSRHQRCRVRIEPKIRVHTDAPADLMTFLKQRRRWTGGFLETMLTHRHMVGNPRYRWLGLIYLPHNTLTMPLQPFLFIANILAGLILFSQGVPVPHVVLWVVIAKIIIDIVVRLLSIVLYRRYFGRQEVSVLGGLIEVLFGALPMTVLSQIAHAWGWVSCWYRQAKW